MTDCSCAACVARCRVYPGWMTPDEARAAIAAGIASKLMCDYLAGEDEIEVLCPAVIGFEGKRAPFWVEAECVLLDGRVCTIHASGFKPVQCRTMFACRPAPSYADKYAVAEMWRNETALIEQWRRLVEHENRDRAKVPGDLAEQ